jgi:dTDP-4-dehydrorhamnose reductase
MLNQCKGTVLAMRAIREVNPAAQLVQTEDLGKTRSTARLAYQAQFENDRRWLTFDLLSGKVMEGHPLWTYLLNEGVSPGELQWFSDNPCPPDVMGMNYYLTSERFLDHRLDNYPPNLHGGNGRHTYADVEAVRVLPEGIAGPRALLREAWEHNGLPIAVTEVHNGCTREQQMLWLLEVWQAAVDVKRQGVDIRAVTPWALLGTYDWASLVTRNEGLYEPGVFDVRGPQPRPTALSQVVRDLAAGVEPDHPALCSKGWWHRPSRLFDCSKPARRATIRAGHDNSRKGDKVIERQPVLITGASGTLGSAFMRICDSRGLHHVGLKRCELDITNQSQIEATLDRLTPWVVINAAGYVRVDDAERDRDTCFGQNTKGAANLAKACAARGIKFVTFSSDLVFDGKKGMPYIESDPVLPQNVYGESKARAEREVLSAHPGALVVRTSAFFGPWDSYNFVTLTLQSLVESGRALATDAEIVSPTYVPDLVNACLDLLIDGEAGIWHLANQGAKSWYEFARMAADMAGLDPNGVQSDLPKYPGRARRPAYSALTSERSLLLPTLENALARYLRECLVPWREEHSAALEELQGVAS